MSKQEKPAAIYMSIDDLYPAPDNPRVNDHVVDKIVRSIQLHGFAAPIVANMQGEILAGHTRWKASKKIGMKTVPVRQIDLTGDQAKLYRIADNKLSEFADWDEDMLKEQLADLEKAFPVDVGDLFTDDELEELLVNKEEKLEDFSESDLDFVYQIIVTDLNEETQAKLLNKLEDEGYKCRPLTI